MAHRAVLAAVLLLLSFGVLGQNLVPNGGFEDGTRGWEGFGVVDATNPHGGAACLRVADEDPAGNTPAATSEIIPITRGKAYRFESWVRGASAGQTALLSLDQYDASGRWISGNNVDFAVAAGTGWTRFTATLRAFHADAAGLRIYLFPVMWTDPGDLTGTAWFDDIRFEEVPDVQTVRGSWLQTQGPVRVWRSAVEQKVRRDGFLNASAGSAPEIALSAARGEYEAVQVVLLPQADDSLAEASISDLRGPKAAIIPASTWTVREVAYVNVTDPTDHASFPGWSPDPLPLLDPPLALSGSLQQPLWLTVKVPQGASAGDYTGSLRLRFASGGSLAIPVRLHVWNFELPKQRHLRSGYGLDIDNLDRYHNLGGDSGKRREVFRLYLQDFAEHRISPYNPYGDDFFDVSFPDWNWMEGAIVPDPANPSSGNRVLEVADDRTDACVATAADNLVPVQQGTSYALYWKARTDGAHEYLVSLGQYDAAGRWISGHNLDFEREGDGTWRSETGAIPASWLAPQAASFRLHLFARTWTDAGELTGRAWFDDVVLTRQGSSANLIANGDLQLAPDQARIETDFTAFDDAMAYGMDTLGCDGFALPLPYFAAGALGQHWSSPFLGCAWGTPEYASAYGRMLRVITDHLASKGWLDDAYTYWYDEPEKSDYPFVVQGMEVIRQADPRLRRLLTEQYEPELAGSVDLWCPIFDTYGTEWAHARQALGEEVWWYVCTGPKAPYPNNFIDHPGIEHRVRFWMAWQNGLQGDLFWDTTFWTNEALFPDAPQDPWEDPASWADYQGQAYNYGNGDGRLIYPPRGWKDGAERIEGPTPSIRWELIREGIEDFEYFQALKDAADRLEARHKSPKLVAQARALLPVPTTVFTSLTEFSDDPSLMAAHKTSVAQTLEKITKKLGGK